MKSQLTTLKSLVSCLAVFCGGVVHAVAAEANDAALLGNLKSATLSLAEGVAQAEKQNGAAISAKFEVEDGKFWLSVYTAKAGLKNDAEHNELIELKGEANAAKWSPATEVFEDKKHLTRSAMQLTLVQTSKLSLADAIKKAGAAQPGTVYSAIPAVQDGNPVFDVKVATADGKSVTVVIDGKTGQATK
jgi:uncharacterized membrane protein YkoI